VDLESVGPVFQGIVIFCGLGGQFARLSHWDKAGIQAISQSGSKDETSRLHSEHQIDVLVDVVFSQRIDEGREA
jgi:hypothetical protein